MAGQLATRLQPKIKALIARLGQEITYRTVTPQTFDIESGSQFNPPSDTTISVTMKDQEFMFDGDNNRVIHTATIRASTLDITDPKQTDEFIIDGVTYVIDGGYKVGGAAMDVKIKRKGAKR